MNFYWTDDDQKDQEMRRLANRSMVYSESARCDWCGDSLNGEASECPVCSSLLCPIHSCVDGRCPEHTRP